ncbi:AAA family ATPase [Mycobacterium sp. TJFP1]
MTDVESVWTERSARVEWASSIRPKKQVWLWEDKIPVSTASALAGRGGTGKTTYGLHMIAQISRGLLPGQYFGEPRPSLIWSGEDAWSTVIVPRLIAAGADLNKVGRLYIASEEDGHTSEAIPKLPLDTDRISKTIVDSGAVLVLIDPIASTMSGDLHREADVRLAVDALARVADKTSAVLMFVRHFGKGGGNASDKMSGSHAFRDAVRSLFLFAEDGDRVVVTQDKGNYAPRGDASFAFRLDSVSVPTDDGPAEVARVVDLGVSDTSVSDVINRTTDDGQHDDIEEWLTDLLANDAVKANEVYQAAHAAGYTVDKAKRAKKRLGILAIRPANPGPWFWQLPEQGAEGTERAGSTEDTREPCSLLPVRSEAYESPQSGAGSTERESCSLPLAAPAEPSSPTPLTTRRQELKSRRTVRFRGREVPRCLVCAKPVTLGQGDTHLGCLSKQENAS